MKFESLKKPTIKEVFINTVESMILSGELSVGEKLPSERTMAEEMDISKTAVHDGLKDLERFGFVKTIPKQGTFVADYVETGSLETLTEIIKYNNNRIDAQTYTSILELRLVLEPLAFQRFVQHAAPEDYEKLQELFDYAEKIPADAQHSAQWADALFAYHHFVYIKSGNNLFSLIYNTFKQVSLLHFKKYCETCAEVAHARIQSIHEALLQGDGETAGDYLIKEIYRYCQLTGLQLCERNLSN